MPGRILVMSRADKRQRDVLLLQPALRLQPLSPKIYFNTGSVHMQLNRDLMDKSRSVEVLSVETELRGGSFECSTHLLDVKSFSRAAPYYGRW
jgi:hypothetical protein